MRTRQMAGAVIGAVVTFGGMVVTGIEPARADDPPCTITGTEEDDVLRGTGGPDVICGLGGNDTIFPAGGDDSVRAGTGKDTIVYRAAEAPVTVDLAAGTATAAGSDRFRGVEGAIGSRFADTLNGDEKGNRLEGGEGADEIAGREGDDVLVGGPRPDTLLGADGDDVIDGGNGDDTMGGGPGRDACYEGKGDGSGESCLGEVISDPNDSRGPLDLSEVRIEPGAEPVWRFTTFEPWSISGTRDRAFFLVLIDVLGDPDPDYNALVRSTGFQLVGTLFHTGPGGEFSVGSLAVSRPNGRSVAVRVPFSLMDEDPSRLVDGSTALARWQIQTVFNGEGCGGACFDLAPSFTSVATTRPLG